MSPSQHVARSARSDHRSAGQVARDILLFFAAPFITIAYLPLFPFIGLYMLTRRGEHLWHRYPTAD